MAANLAPIPVIAVDGPTASGKGTVAQLVARRLGFFYLDSGALYRLTALAASLGRVEASDEVQVSKVALTLNVQFDGEQIRLDGQDVTNAIRDESVGQRASQIAAMPMVRAALLERQRAFRHPPGLVCDGRDMGSVVFPDATLKVFLTASVEARAERRYKQLIQKGMSVIMADVVKELRIRDERDTNRQVAPLRCLDDARLLETDFLSADAAAQQILDWYHSG